MAKKKKVLGPGRLPNIMPNYPHMLNEDRDIWSTFLALDEYPIEKVWYDVHCGFGLPVPAGSPESAYKISQGVTRKRIDVICTVKNELWIIEIKPHANMKALGQIITYERLFRDEYETSYKIVPVLLCWSIDPDIMQSLVSMGVRVLHPIKEEQKTEDMPI